MINRILHINIIKISSVIILGIGLAIGLPWLTGSLNHAAQGNTPIPPSECTAVLGDTIYNGPGSDPLQTAVDQAESGDVIQVEGECIGVSVRKGISQTLVITKSLTIRGRVVSNSPANAGIPDDHPATLDAGGEGRVILIFGNIDVTLKNLEITGGRAAGGNPFFEYGGGIYTESALTLTNSIIYSNTAEIGGGIYNKSNLLVLEDVQFVDNYAKTSGGGLHNADVSPRLTDVGFMNNSSGDHGGGVSNFGGTPSFENVVFKGNYTNQLGGGMFNYSSSPVMTNTLFSGNHVDYSGGGMLNMSSSHPRLTNVTFSGNAAGDEGGAIDNNNGSTLLRNSIIWNNQTEGVTGIISANIQNDPGQWITVSHSLLEGSGGSSVWLPDPGWENLGGNLDTNPDFVIPVNPSNAPTTAGNLRLNSSSPAVDTGNNTFIGDVPTDLDGEARVKDGDGNGTAIVDMGAYETKGYFQLNISVAGTGSGRVSSSSPEFECTDTCSEIVKEDSVLKLKTKPDQGSFFSSWSGDCSGKGDCSLIMDADKSVTAEFSPGISHYLPLQIR